MFSLHKQKVGLARPQRPSFCSGRVFYTTISNFAQKKVPTRSRTEQLIRESIKSDGQGTVLFVFCWKERIILLSMAKGCKMILLMFWCIMVSVVTQQRAPGLAMEPIHFRIYFHLVFQWGDTCSITLCVYACVSAHLSVYLHFSCPIPHQQLLNPLISFKEM